MPTADGLGAVVSCRKDMYQGQQKANHIHNCRQEFTSDNACKKAQYCYDCLKWIADHQWPTHCAEHAPITHKKSKSWSPSLDAAAESCHEDYLYRFALEPPDEAAQRTTSDQRCSKCQVGILEQSREVRQKQCSKLHDAEVDSIPCWKSLPWSFYVDIAWIRFTETGIYIRGSPDHLPSTPRGWYHSHRMGQR